MFGNPIPGDTPIEDISELKLKNLRVRSQLNAAEAANITKALARYLVGTITRADAPFDFAWFCDLHREMFGDVWGWAGRIRRSVTNIGIEPQYIEARLLDLTLSLPHWAREPLLLQATMLHHRSVQIHPFENGNGRWSRALANIWLRLHGHALTLWPASDLSEVSPVRAEYIEAIKTADNGDYGPLLALHTRFTNARP
jgi:Fic-DOC domain mobile mystery protein B